MPAPHAGPQHQQQQRQRQRQRQRQQMQHRIRPRPAMPPEVTRRPAAPHAQVVLAAAVAAADGEAMRRR